MSRADRATSGESGALNPHRVNPDGLIDELQEWRAVNWTIEDGLKVPKRPDNTTVNAKSDNSSTWGEFDRALSNALENENLGFGFPCEQSGHPLLFIDVDLPGGWTPGYDRLGGCVVERSPSGNQRVILRGCEKPEWWTNQSDDGEGTREVALYSDSGYVTLTGDVVEGYEPPLEPTHQLAFEEWLKEAWYAFNPDADEGAEPWVTTDKSDNHSGGYDGGEWLTDNLVEEALAEINPDVHHGTWIRLAYAVYDSDSGSRGKSIFKSWSKGGTKWDDSAERQIEAVWSGARVGDGAGDVSVATLVYEAKENGWTPPTSPSTSGGNTTTDLPLPDEYDVVDGGYAKYHPPRDDDGEGYHERITNFQLETLSRLTHDDGTREFHLRIYPADGDPYTVTCEPVVFNDLRKFRRNVLDGWTATFDGSQDDLNRLKEFVGGQDAKHRKGTKLLGLYGGEWVTPDGALTADGWTDDPDTVFTDVDTPLANAFGLSPESGDTYDRETVEEIVRLLPRTRTPERFIPVLGWFYAAPFRPYIQQWEGEFNILNVLGDTGSGKTTTLETLWQAFGVDEAMPEAKATPFSIMRMLASSNALPVILDEYKPAEIREYKLNELHSNLRESTRGGVVTKGRADMGVDTYHLKAPVCISGEQPLEGPAEERRTILTVFKRDVTVGDTPEQRAFAQLVGGEAGGEWYDGHNLTHHALAYYQWVLEQDESELKSLWEECREAVLSLLEADGHTGLDDMVIQGFQTVKFGATLYRAFADSVDIDPDDTPVTAPNIDNAIRYVAESGTGAAHTSHLDRLLGLMTRAASSGYLTDGEHYTLVNNGQPNAELAIHLPTAFDKVRKYARDHDVRSDDLLSSAGDYKARIKDAADDPESYVTTHSQKSPPLNRCVRIHAGDAAELVDGFEPGPFGVDRDSDGDKTHSDRFNPVSIHDVADDPTGYPTVRGEIKTIDCPEGDDSPAVKATLVNGSSAIEVIAWDDPDALECGGEVIIENAATTEFDRTTQLVVREGVTTVHDAPENGQRQIDEGVN